MSARTGFAGAAVAALAIAGCGGGGEGGGQNAAPTSAAGGSDGGTATTAPANGAPSQLRLKADPSGQLAFDKATLHASAGLVTITMGNPSTLSHSVAIEGNGVSATGEVVTQGGTSTVSARLRPGTYTFFCTVPGHRGAGMQGTLSVQ